MHEDGVRCNWEKCVREAAQQKQDLCVADHDACTSCGTKRKARWTVVRERDLGDPRETGYDYHTVDVTRELCVRCDLAQVRWR